MSAVFEQDLTKAIAYTFEMWKRRPLRERIAEKLLRPIRSQL
jgi:cardiolipin synthase